MTPSIAGRADAHALRRPRPARGRHDDQLSRPHGARHRGARLTQELGLSAAVMGLVFSAFSWTYAAAQIPGGDFPRPFRRRLTYFLSVASGRCSRCCRASRPGCIRCSRSASAWGSRSAVLSDQQPRGDDLVSAAGAGARHRRLHRRRIPRPGLLQPRAVLADGRLRLARAVHRGRRRRALSSRSSGGPCIASRTRARP